MNIRSTWPLHVVLAVALLLSFTACDDAPMVDPQLDSEADLRGGESFKALSGPGALTVMTRNVYVGGNVDPILFAAPEDVPAAVAQVFQQVISTNFAERADAFAQEIAETRPHLVGLQEISLIRTQSPGDRVIGGTTPAETVFLDQLDILMRALTAHGLDYRVVGSVENLDIEAPMVTGVEPLSFDDVRLNDYDVLLARGDVETANVVAQNYAAALPVPGIGTLHRGYVGADATVNGRTFRVFTSHLEPVAIPEILPIHLGQVAELVAATNGLNVPAVVMGDLNTGPGRPGYQALADGGLVDLWDFNVRSHKGNGYTCCFPDDLRGDNRTPDQRIDLVFYRSANPSHGHGGLGSVFMDVVGDEPKDVTPSGLWPSDHAGVAASLKAPASAWTR